MQKKQGFLLAECMIVVGLTAFLTALSFSFMHLFERLVVKAEIHLLVNTIEAQRAIAVIDEKDSTITFDRTQKTYVYDSLSHTCTHSVEFVYPEGSYGPPSAPTTLIQQPLSFVDNKIICFATGAISSGVLYIGSVTQNCFYALSSSIGEWGVLRLYCYDKNKWKKIS
jgi:Tfp pilus assembly major pilin PilA